MIYKNNNEKKLSHISKIDYFEPPWDLSIAYNNKFNTHKTYQKQLCKRNISFLIASVKSTDQTVIPEI